MKDTVWDKYNEWSDRTSNLIEPPHPQDVFYAGFESRDDEIKELKNALEYLVDAVRDCSLAVHRCEEIRKRFKME